jgi:hypothetical protein
MKSTVEAQSDCNLHWGALDKHGLRANRMQSTVDSYGGEGSLREGISRQTVDVVTV